MEAAIQPDERWDIIYGIKSHEEFMDKFNLKFHLKPEAAPDIHGIFRVVQKLLEHSYFEYEFGDVAALKAKLWLETALKIRYQELSGKFWPQKGKNYKELLMWFMDGGYLEYNSKDLVDYVRDVRNLSAHERMHSFSGALGAQHVRIAVDLVNDVYEDKEKRTERIRETAMINSNIEKLLGKGCMLELASGESFMTYLMVVVFYDNKRVPQRIHLSYKPIFPIPDQYNVSDSIAIYECFPLTCHFIELDEEQVIGRTADGEEVFKLSLIVDPTTRKAWNDWKKSFDAYRATMIFFAHVDFDPVSSYMADLRTEFHKD